MSSCRHDENGILVKKVLMRLEHTVVADTGAAMVSVETPSEGVRTPN